MSNKSHRCAIARKHGVPGYKSRAKNKKDAADCHVFVQEDVDQNNIRRLY